MSDDVLQEAQDFLVTTHIFDGATVQRMAVLIGGLAEEVRRLREAFNGCQTREGKPVRTPEELREWIRGVVEAGIDCNAGLCRGGQEQAARADAAEAELEQLKARTSPPGWQGGVPVARGARRPM